MEQTRTYVQDSDGSVAIVANVPMLVCMRCEETYLTRDAALGIEQALASRSIERLVTIVTAYEPDLPSGRAISEHASAHRCVPYGLSCETWPYRTNP